MESAKDSIFSFHNNLALLQPNQQQLHYHLHNLLTKYDKVLLLPYEIRPYLFHIYLFLSTLHFSPLQMLYLIFFGPLLLLFTFLILIRLLKKLLRIFFPFIWTKLLDVPQESTFLEVTFPSDTNKEAYATEQLYRVLHKLAQPKNYLALLY